ncbi:MAG: NADH-quinone oxidoreductase subunit A [Acidimicrobiia bacterium]|nr:NADH-quinone oxidoreductase subunit A [Acidimicrobiia bacterium]
MPPTLTVLIAAATAGQDYSDFLRQYLTVVIMAGLAMALVGTLLGVGALLRPSRRQGDKHVTYESGVDPVGEHWSQSHVRYYVFALLFVIFDVEAVFIFPWATRLDADTELIGSGGEVLGVLGPYGTIGLIKMFLFIAVLALGLVYAWRKGVLRWM